MYKILKASISAPCQQTDQDDFFDRAAVFLFMANAGENGRLVDFHQLARLGIHWIAVDMLLEKFGQFGKQLAAILLRYPVAAVVAVFNAA